MKKVILRAVGDNLLHRQIYEWARQKDGTYRFDEMYRPVKPLIEAADLSVINQETIYIAENQKVTFFPFFGSPAQLGDAVARAGFQVVTHASNHALDKGYAAIKNTVEYWNARKEQCVFTGIHTSMEDKKKLRVVERNGIRIALLNYTALLNYHIIPPTAPWCVDVMKPYNKPTIARQIRKAHELADVVVVFPHWGCEYLYEPVESQKKWARFLAEAGADLIIGTHPHVLQYREFLKTKDHRTVPCFYSLGNFTARQVLPGTALGGMADIELCMENGKVRIPKADIIPLIIHMNREETHFACYPLSEYSEELARENAILADQQKYFGGETSFESVRQLFSDIMEKKAMEKSYFKTPKDVRKMNMKAIMAAFSGKKKKA